MKTVFLLIDETTCRPVTEAVGVTTDGPAVGRQARQNDARAIVSLEPEDIQRVLHAAGITTDPYIVGALRDVLAVVEARVRGAEINGALEKLVNARQILRAADDQATIDLKPGDEIELLEMPSDPHPVPVGSRGIVGKVQRIMGCWQIEVMWDCQRSLSLVVPPDKYRKL